MQIVIRARQWENMNTVFIRHNFGQDCIISITKFWKKRIIAIHFNNIKSTNPNDYECAGRKALNKLWKYCDEGALVAATYRIITKSEIIIGEIKKGSIIKVIEDQNQKYKTVKLVNARIISLLDYPLLSAIQPRQTTLTNWKSAENLLNSIYFNKKKDLDVDSLNPSQLEVICYEYLKKKNILKSILLPIGRGLPDVDIFGFNNCFVKILAQVTHAKDKDAIKTKLEALKAYKRRNVKLFFFCPYDAMIKDPVVNIIAIENVYDELSKDKYYGKYIDKMQHPDK